jgi:hypothetical protein
MEVIRALVLDEEGDSEVKSGLGTWDCSGAGAMLFDAVALSPLFLVSNLPETCHDGKEKPCCNFLNSRESLVSNCPL